MSTLEERLAALADTGYRLIHQACAPRERLEDAEEADAARADAVAEVLARARAQEYGTRLHHHRPEPDEEAGPARSTAERLMPRVRDANRRSQHQARERGRAW